jgi:hypothetical protein
MSTFDLQDVHKMPANEYFPDLEEPRGEIGEQKQNQLIALHGVLDELRLRESPIMDFGRILNKPDDVGSASEENEVLSPASGTTTFDRMMEEWSPSLNQMPSVEKYDNFNNQPSESPIRIEVRYKLKAALYEDELRTGLKIIRESSHGHRGLTNTKELPITPPVGGHHSAAPIPQLDGIGENDTNTCSSGVPPTSASQDSSVYVDASGCGIGFVYANQWAAWKLKRGWQYKGWVHRGIQWAEAVAVELGVRLMVEAGYAGKEIRLRSDNMQVVNAFSLGHPNGSGIIAEDIIQSTKRLCEELNIRLRVSWVRGAINPADGPSRLAVGSDEERFPYTVEIPPYLQDIVEPFRQ